jgi:opacity protein-like surface antigen
MRQIQKILFGVILAAAGVASDKAHAQSPSVYFGIHGGKGLATTELTTDALGGVSLDGLGSNGLIGGVHAGVDLQLANSIVFVGAFGGYSWQEIEFNANVGTASVNATLGDSWYVGGRAGVVVKGSKFYALAAYRRSEMAFSSTPSWITGKLSLDDPRGWDIGLGAEIPIAKNISLGIEGIYTQYDKGEFAWGGVPTKVHGEIDQISVLARLNIQFGAVQSIFDDTEAKPAAAKCDKKLATCK